MTEHQLSELAPDRAGRRPDIPASAIAELLPLAHDHSPDDIPVYGASLTEVVAGSPTREWLEAAVLAGYVPYYENIELALAANQIWWKAFISDAEQEGNLGDAIYQTQIASSYRSLARTLEGFADELDQKRSQLMALDE